LNTSGATLYLARCGEESLALPQATRLHLFVIVGAWAMGEGAVRAGSRARLVHEGGRLVHPNRPETTLLVWALD
jgi:hypothetical protein